MFLKKQIKNIIVVSTLTMAACSQASAHECFNYYESTPACCHYELTAAPEQDPSYINYIKMGAGALSGIEEADFSPFIGIGRRYFNPQSAVDISFCGAMSQTESKYDEQYSYSIPKITYLLYAMPQSKTSFFYGAGLSWGGIVNKKEFQRFNGLMAEVAIGLEFQRDQPMRPILQLDVTQPFLATNKKGDLPGPSVTLGLALGF